MKIISENRICWDCKEDYIFNYKNERRPNSYKLCPNCNSSNTGEKNRKVEYEIEDLDEYYLKREVKRINQGLGFCKFGFVRLIPVIKCKKELINNEEFLVFLWHKEKEIEDLNKIIKMLIKENELNNHESDGNIFNVKK